MIAALYVEPRGVYSGIEGVEVWGLPDRDARLYAGPWPVVAHPPCERWGHYWSGGPSHHGSYRKGDDGGCFAAALTAVRRFGGVLEHPAESYAWDAFDLPTPPRAGGWTRGLCGGWSCRVEQGHYGHPARKATWLYTFGCELPVLVWGASAKNVRMDDGFHSTEERRAAKRNGHISAPFPRFWRTRTPEAFRDLLIKLARSAQFASLKEAFQPPIIHKVER